MDRSDQTPRPRDAVPAPDPPGGARTPAAIFAAAALVLCLLADLDGYEGDDLNVVVPMLDLGAARDGLVALYRYDLQPLTYLLGTGLLAATGAPMTIFLVAPVSIAAALAWLFCAIRATHPVPVPIFACLVLLTPEILFTGLYFNATAPAYACAAAALAAICCLRDGWPRTAATGLAIAAAVLFRFDLVLIAPALATLMALRDGRVRPALAAGVVAAALWALAGLAGLFDLGGLIGTYRDATAEIAARAGEVGWDAYRRIAVATTLLSPLGWVLYPAGIVLLAATATPRERWRGAILAAACAPALLPMPGLLSVKYAMPLFVVLPLLAAAAWRRLDAVAASTARWRAPALIGTSVALLAVAPDIDRAPPYLGIAATDARQIGTHDGERSWGAYAMQMLRVDRLRPRTARERDAARLVEALEAHPGLAIVFVGRDSAFGTGAVGWRHARLLLARAGHRGHVAGPGLVRVDVGASRLWLCEDRADVPAGILADALVVDASDDGLAALDGLGRIPRPATGTLSRADRDGMDRTVRPAGDPIR